MAPNGIKWLLLDLDNTLLDFDQGAIRSLREALSHFGIEPTEALMTSYEDINRHCWAMFERGSLTVSELKARRFESFVETNGLDVGAAAINDVYIRHLAQQVRPVAGALAFLRWASQFFSLSLVTNGFAEVQRPRLDLSGIGSFFHQVSISEEIGWHKPSVQFFDIVFQGLNRPSSHEVMIIGDSLTSDIKGGLDYGLYTCWFNPSGLRPVEGVLPHYTVSSFAELRALWPAIS